MITHLHDHQFDDTYAQLVDLIGDKPWLKATKDHSQQFAANPLSVIHITHDNRVAYGLAYFDELGMALQDTERWPTVVHALTFAAQVCELASKAIEDASRASYIKRVKGAFKNPSDMRALSFEHLTALSLYKQGATIFWPDESTGTGTCDLLVTTQEGVEFEVECKSNSPDKGRAITIEESSAFFNCLLPKLPVRHQAGQALLLKVCVPGRLPTSISALDLLVNDVVGACNANASATDGGVSIDLRVLNSPILLHSSSEVILQAGIVALAEEAFGTAEGYRLIAVKGKTAICLEIASEREARIFKAMWETAKHAVQDQMTGTRPGCLVMRMEGLTRDQMLRLAEDSPSPLAVFAQKVLSDPRHQHLACVAFISGSDVVQISDTQLTEQSVSYVVDQQDGPHAKLRIGRLMRGEQKSDEMKRTN
ncbi:hypothetical protein APB26_32110 [Pseudomonas aeruginosa]|uniref:hypothetical protein n=1 Tax=Pseudomonas aeruginosa TaxID=287 RepID=UPI00071BFD64|nr:hypothetical protein [Pseudomonas aeruginosa]KSQ21630.1 hypothetical protein APB26_32110 [Pseudomonas aeruginosa]RPV61299.1 hypothetical protein IPC838_18440 [Pseudomonas aeruginosa]